MWSGPGSSRGHGHIFLIELFKIVSHEHVWLFGGLSFFRGYGSFLRAMLESNDSKKR
jgi:hypothetical protein